MLINLFKIIAKKHVERDKEIFFNVHKINYSLIITYFELFSESKLVGNEEIYLAGKFLATCEKQNLKTRRLLFFQHFRSVTNQRSFK